MEKWKGGIRDWDTVVAFGKYKKIVHDSTSIMNVAVLKIRLGVHTMSASEASPHMRPAEFRARSALKF